MFRVELFSPRRRASYNRSLLYTVDGKQTRHPCYSDARRRKSILPCFAIKPVFRCYVRNLSNYHWVTATMDARLNRVRDDKIRTALGKSGVSFHGRFEYLGTSLQGHDDLGDRCGTLVPSATWLAEQRRRSSQGTIVPKRSARGHERQKRIN